MAIPIRLQGKLMGVVGFTREDADLWSDDEFSAAQTIVDEAAEALEKQRKAYRIVYVSTSVSGIIAAVESGLAVAPLGRSYLPKHLRELGPESGFPLLPTARIILHKSPEADDDPAVCFARYVAASFRKNQAV